MPYLLKYEDAAITDLARLNPEIARRITFKLDYYVATPNPLRYAKSLTGALRGSYRFRIGSYRALFDVTGYGVITVLEVFQIDHRKDVYP